MIGMVTVKCERNNVLKGAKEMGIRAHFKC